MFGFLFGTLCLVGLFGVIRSARWHGRYGDNCGGGRAWGGGRHGRHGRRERYMNEGFTRAAGEVFKRRLDIDEDQESIVDHALGDLRTALKELYDELKASRAGLADAFRGDTVDDAALAAVFAKHDDAVARARRQVVSALKQIHAVLEPEQRAKAAEWIASSQGRWV